MANETILQPIPHIGRTNNEEQFVEFKSQLGVPVSGAIIQTLPPVHNIYGVGTFTAQLQFGGASAGLTYTSSVAQYVQTNGLTMVWLRLTIAAIGTSQGNASITGLPFAATLGALGVATVNKGQGLGAMYAQIVAGASEVTLWEQNVNNLLPLTEKNFYDGADMAVCISYFS